MSISISVTVHTASAMSDWDDEAFKALDVLGTEAKLAGLLTERIKDVTGADDVRIDVRREDAGDRLVISGAESAAEERDLYEAVWDVLYDFPWHDGQYWAEFRYLTTADGRRVY